MSPLAALAPDQRAVLELLLRQGRDYAELSELLGLPESGVRSRAHAALAALAPDRPAPVGEDGAVADWILGQQDAEESARTSESVARMPAWHAWAARRHRPPVRGRRRGAPRDPAARERRRARPHPPRSRRRSPRGGKGRARPVRDAAAAAGARRPASGPSAAAAGKPRPRPRRPPPLPPPAARLGGGLPLPSSRRGGARAARRGRARGRRRAVPRLPRRRRRRQPRRLVQRHPHADRDRAGPVVNEVALKGNGNKAQGLMRVFKGNDGGLVFALAADKIPPNKARGGLRRVVHEEGRAHRATSASQSQVGKNGVFTTGGPQQGQETQFAKWLADYDTIVVARAARALARTRSGPARSCSPARCPAARTSRLPYPAASCRACPRTSTSCGRSPSGGCSAPRRSRGSATGWSRRAGLRGARDRRVRVLDRHRRSPPPDAPLVAPADRRRGGRPRLAAGGHGLPPTSRGW